MYSLVDARNQMQNESLSALKEVARSEEDRKRKNDQIKQAEKQMKTTSTVGGATTGAMLGAQYGTAGGPWGMAIGAVIGGAVGYLSTEI